MYDKLDSGGNWADLPSNKISNLRDLSPIPEYESHPHRHNSIIALGQEFGRDLLIACQRSDVVQIRRYQSQFGIHRRLLTQVYQE